MFAPFVLDLTVNNDPFLPQLAQDVLNPDIAGGHYAGGPILRIACCEVAPVGGISVKSAMEISVAPMVLQVTRPKEVVYMFASFYLFSSTCLVTIVCVVGHVEAKLCRPVDPHWCDLVGSLCAPQVSKQFYQTMMPFFFPEKLVEPSVVSLASDSSPDYDATNEDGAFYFVDYISLSVEFILLYPSCLSARFGTA